MECTLQLDLNDYGGIVSFPWADWWSFIFQSNIVCWISPCTPEGQVCCSPWCELPTLSLKENKKQKTDRCMIKDAWIIICFSVSTCLCSFLSHSCFMYYIKYSRGSILKQGLVTRKNSGASQMQRILYSVPVFLGSGGLCRGDPGTLGNARLGLAGSAGTLHHPTCSFCHCVRGELSVHSSVH